MILITGGAFQGKRAYAADIFSLNENDFSDGATCTLEDLYRAKAVTGFHEYIRRSLKSEPETASPGELRSLADSLAKRNPDIVVITDELGCGVIPVDAFDREWRETAGRVSCDLAAHSAEVHRVVCGIGTVIKRD